MIKKYREYPRIYYENQEQNCQQKYYYIENTKL